LFDFRANHWQEIIVGGYSVGHRMCGGLGYNSANKEIMVMGGVGDAFLYLINEGQHGFSIKKNSTRG